MMSAGECACADSTRDRSDVSIHARSGIEGGRIVRVAGAAEMRVRLANKSRVGKDENRQ